MTAHLCVADNFSFLTNLLNNATSNMPDLMLTPGLGVHRSLLASLSPLLSSILQTTVSDFPLLVIPHVETSTVERLVQLVYSGSCSVAYSEMPNLVQLIKDLELTVVLQSLSLGTKVKQVEKMTSHTNEELVDIDINDEDGISVDVVLGDLTEECEVCRKKFRAGEELGLHFVKQHCFKQDSRLFETGKVQCIRCDKMFNDRDVIKLLEHIGHDHRELLENGSLEMANNCDVVEVNENISPFKELDNVNRNIGEVGAVLASIEDYVEFEESANNDEIAVAMEDSVANMGSTPPNAGFELDVIDVELKDDITGNTVIHKDSYFSPIKESVDVGAAAVNGESVVEKRTFIIGFQISMIDFENSNVTGNAANNNDSFVAVNDNSTVLMEESTVVSENSTHDNLDISVKDVDAVDICVAVNDNNNGRDQHKLKNALRSPLINNEEASKDESDDNTDSNDTECDDEAEIFPFLGQCFYCEICQKITPTKQEFVAHIRSLHQHMFDEAESRSKSELEKILYYLKKMKKFASLKPKSDGKISLESNPPIPRNRMKLRPKLVNKSIEDVRKTETHGVTCTCGAKECWGAHVIDIDSEDEEPAQHPATGDIIVIDSDEEDPPQTQVATLDVSDLVIPVRLTRARKKIGDVVVNVTNDVPAITDLDKLNNGDDDFERSRPGRAGSRAGW